MGERQRSRDAVERLAVRIKDQGGHRVTSEQAQREAAQVARQSDKEREAGALKNKNGRKG